MMQLYHHLIYHCAAQLQYQLGRHVAPTIKIYIYISNESLLIFYAQKTKGPVDYLLLYHFMVVEIRPMLFGLLVGYA